jgi:8-oxo-dGTP diphosphatase
MSKSLLVAVVAGCVIEKDDKYLLVQEKQPKAYGLWNLPAGHVDEGETFEEAAIREAHEETGFSVELGQKLETVHPSTDRPVLHAYKASIISGELKIDPNELLDVRWFTFQEIEALQADNKLRNDWVIDTIKLTRD